MTQSFAKEYMDNSSEVRIGMLATKVVIQRPWMHPELFAHTENFFRAVEAPVLPKEAVTKDELLSAGPELNGGVDKATATENSVMMNQSYCQVILWRC